MKPGAFKRCGSAAFNFDSPATSSGTVDGNSVIPRVSAAALNASQSILDSVFTRNPASRQTETERSVNAPASRHSTLLVRETLSRYRCSGRAERGCQIGHADHTGRHRSVSSTNTAYGVPGLSLRPPGGVIRLSTWAIRSGINWCLRPYAIRGLSLPKDARRTCVEFRLDLLLDQNLDFKGESVGGALRVHVGETVGVSIKAPGRTCIVRGDGIRSLTLTFDASMLWVRSRIVLVERYERRVKITAHQLMFFPSCCPEMRTCLSASLSRQSLLGNLPTFIPSRSRVVKSNVG